MRPLARAHRRLDQSDEDDDPAAHGGGGGGGGDGGCGGGPRPERCGAREDGLLGRKRRRGAGEERRVLEIEQDKYDLIVKMLVRACWRLTCEARRKSSRIRRFSAGAEAATGRGG